MKTLVIGCGYLGSIVAAMWRDRGDTVFATTRRDDGAVLLRSLGIEPVLCDVLEPTGLEKLSDLDSVLFAVGFDRTSGRSMREVYVDGLNRVLDRLPQPRRFLYVSSTSVYGQTDGEWIDEAAPTEPQEESGRIVLEAEGALRSRLPEAIVLRFAGIYGPGRLLRRKTLEAGEPIVGDADKWLNLIHVQDGARAILAAEERAVSGSTTIVSDGHPVRRRDFYDELARMLGAPTPRYVAPPAGAPTPPHEKGNRRLVNRKMIEGLAVKLEYPDYRAGLAGV